MSLTTISSIARPLHFSYSTNIAVAIIILVVLVGGTVFQLAEGLGIFQGFIWAIQLSFTLFLAWAITREIDPDHDLSAFVALGLTLAGYVTTGPLGLAQLILMLFVFRLLNRTTGLPLRITDSLFILGLGLWLLFNGWYVYGVMLALAFAWDSKLSGLNVRHLLYSAIALTATIIMFFIAPVFPQFNLNKMEILFFLIAAILFGFVILTTRKVRSKDDNHNKKIDTKRIRAAQSIALITLIAGILWMGKEAILELLPLWLAAFGVGIYRIFLLLFSYFKS